MQNIILYLTAFSQLGGFIAINFPSYLNLLILKQFQIDQLTFNLLFTVISFPNIILPFVIGYLTKFFKPRTAFLFMIFLVFTGQCLCTTAIYQNEFSFFILGRFIMGFGYINSGQPRNILVRKLFPKNNGFAFSIYTTLGKLGVFISALYFAQFANVDSCVLIRPALLINLLTLFSLISATLSYKYDIEFDSLKLIENQLLQQQSEQNNADLSIIQEDISEFYGNKEARDISQNINENNKGLVEILKSELGIQFWLIAIFTSLGMILYYTLINNVQLIFKEQYKLEGPFIVYIQIIPALMSSSSGLFLGKLMDKVGKRATFCLICGFFAVFTFSINIFLNDQVLVEYNKGIALMYMISLGIFFSIYATLELPCTNIVVKSEYIGFASGIIISMQNITITISGIVMGSLINPHYYYSNPLITYNGVYMIIALVFFGIMYALYLLDVLKFGSRLQLKYNDDEKQQFLSKETKIIGLNLDISYLIQEKQFNSKRKLSFK